MFGAKKAPHIEEQDARNGQYQQRFEYRSIAMIGIVQFDKMLNEAAAAGWELVNGSAAGTTHFAYMRRELKR